MQPNLAANPGYGLFYVGLTSNVTADWQWASGPDFNLPTAYFYSSFGNQVFLGTSNSSINLSFALQIQGNPAPEPSTALLGALIPILCWCRRATQRKCGR